ncbi:hypothetical protein HID58_052316 [Brassica napus]|uniref:BnaC03g23870D protein n=3 Tax=Brassica TaxID=3705 RepID=A0A078HZP9_BRANA|nr:hypothetical protein HID58_052316 [Brassica napus]CAF1701062.1 unnamed protein product [Brassica napus]CDY42819.1 BnaC03g23870D [Brassica napus]
MRRRRIAESASQKTMTTTSYHPNSQKTHTPNATHSRDCFIVNDYPSSSTGKRKRLSDRRREYLDLFPSWNLEREADMLLERLSKKPPSLVDLCVRLAIDNVRYIGYVGGVDFQLLEKILQHCTLEQLMHIEDSTQDTDLSPVTNELWKRFYEKQYGAKNLSFVMEKMERSKVSFKWRELYEAKLKVVEEDEKEAVDRLKQRYKNEDARKQSRQTKLCAKAPPVKKPFWGNSGTSYNLSNVKSNIMKKAKLDVLKSQEVKNLTAIKRNTIQKGFSSASKRTGLSANLPSTSRSNSCGEQVKNLTAVKRNTTQKPFSISAPKRTGLSSTAPSTSRSGEGNLPPKRIKCLLGAAPSTSRSNSYGEGNLPPKRINSLTGSAPSTSRSNSYGEGKLPPKRNSLPEVAPSTSRNTATKRKHVI